MSKYRRPRDWLRAWTRTVRWEPPYAIPCAISYVRMPAGTNVIWFVNDSAVGELIGVSGWEIFNDNPINGPIMAASQSYGGAQVASGQPLSGKDRAVPGKFLLASFAGTLPNYFYASAGNIAFSMRQETPRLIIPPNWALGVEFGVFAGTGQLTFMYSVATP